MKALQRKTKILYLVNQFSMHGGIQRMLSHKIDAWVEECGYEVVVVTVNQNNAPVVYPPKNEFKLIDLNLKGINQHHLKELYQFVGRIKKVINQESPDLLITTLTGIPSLILPLLKHKVKKVLEIHSSGALSVTSQWKYKWPFLQMYHKVVLLNEDEKKYYKLDNLVAIPNFIKITNSAVIYEDREKRIIAAGRIHAEKQYDHLIKIWEKIYKKFPEWKVDIYGNGDAKLLKGYQKYINDHQIPGIEFHKATDNLEIELMKSSVLCLTSETECFPMILIESKKCMLPVISYDSPNGPRHIIKDDGILVANGNIEDFAEELERILLDEEYRKKLANHSVRNVHAFSAKEIIQKWNQLLDGK